MAASGPQTPRHYNYRYAQLAFQPVVAGFPLESACFSMLPAGLIAAHVPG